MSDNNMRDALQECRAAMQDYIETSNVLFEMLDSYLDYVDNGGKDNNRKKGKDYSQE